ncbi:hypothetical protein OROHE_011666 [Orobanche hederae]
MATVIHIHSAPDLKYARRLLYPQPQPTRMMQTVVVSRRMKSMSFKSSKLTRKKASKLAPIEQTKTILHHSSRGVLSTFSLKYEGYPSGSMVDFACDAYGSPCLAVSNMALHTKNLLANPRCSLLVAKDPEDRTDLVIVVHGDAIRVSETDKEAVRTAYFARHPNAFWVDFGDFQFLRIEPEVVRYVSGVATALLESREFTKEEFKIAKVDHIYQFSKPITSHMNKDHADDTKLIVQHSTSIPVDYVYMLDIDSLGFDVKADRKDVKTLIVEMLQAARTQAN